MQTRWLMIVAALVSVIGVGSAPSADLTAEGLWQSLDEDTRQPNAWFLIRDHGGIFDGSIVKIFPTQGEDPNPICDGCKDDRHGRPMLGLDIIRGMKHDGMSYTDGTILDPRNGNIYNAQMTLSPDGRTLTVRGYLGITLLGKNQFWTRLPETAFNEIDPRFNPNPPASGGHKKPTSGQAQRN
jgi:uncharacterized protein (DUF2147 family)